MNTYKDNSPITKDSETLQSTLIEFDAIRSEYMIELAKLRNKYFPMFTALLKDIELADKA